MLKKKVIIKKMCVIGEAAVGKTSLIRRFVYDKFSDTYIATIGAKASAKEVEISFDSKNVTIQLQIWDIIGLRSFAKLQTKVYNGADGAFIVTDISRKGTLRTFELWLLALFKNAGEIPVILLANKSDLNHDYGKNEIEKLLQDYEIPYYITCAKTGEYVKEAFYELGKMMLEPKNEGVFIPRLEQVCVSKMDLEPELEPGRSLSLFEVEDIIIARFCDLLDDPYFAMSLINEQYILAVRNYKDPSVNRLNWIVEQLIKAASSRVDSIKLDKEQRIYTDLIKMIA